MSSFDGQSTCRVGLSGFVGKDDKFDAGHESIEVSSFGTFT